MIIGIDFDNTIISYDELIYRTAREKGLIQDSHPKSKKELRDTIRKLPDGETRWQEIQALIYGPRIMEATLIPGIKEFLIECIKKNIQTYIISHKTEYSNLYNGKKDKGTNFQQAAATWIKQNLNEIPFFFEPTREAKIERIKKMECTHFIDDLEEVFLEQSFPKNIKKIIFQPQTKKNGLTFSDWHELRMLLDIPDIQSVNRIYGGKNSRVYKVTAEKQYCVKLYADDKRCQKEYAALTFLSKHTTKVPKPVAVQQKLAVYELVEGNRIQNVTDADINQAVDFIAELQTLKNYRDNASEACFSVHAITESIEQRLNKLLMADKLRAFLVEFKTTFQKIIQWCKEECERNGISYENDIKDDERVLSPSDFGFHNALKKNNVITFLDFEHFGLDDPAKMLCDFLLHPAMSLSDAQKQLFAQQMIEKLKNKNLAARVKIAYPLFALKWCTIMLNEFIPRELSRRRYATENLNKEALQKQQLAKAQALLAKIHDEYTSFHYRLD